MGVKILFHLGDWGYGGVKMPRPGSGEAGLTTGSLSYVFYGFYTFIFIIHSMILYHVFENLSSEEIIHDYFIILSFIIEYIINYTLYMLSGNDPDIEFPVIRLLYDFYSFFILFQKNIFLFSSFSFFFFIKQIFWKVFLQNIENLFLKEFI